MSIFLWIIKIIAIVLILITVLGFVGQLAETSSNSYPGPRCTRCTRYSENDKYIITNIKVKNPDYCIEDDYDEFYAIKYSIVNLENGEVIDSSLDRHYILNRCNFLNKKEAMDAMEEMQKITSIEDKKED